MSNSNFLGLRFFRKGFQAFAQVLEDTICHFNLEPLSFILQIWGISEVSLFLPGTQPWLLFWLQKSLVLGRLTFKIGGYGWVPGKAFWRKSKNTDSEAWHEKCRQVLSLMMTILTSRCLVAVEWFFEKFSMYCWWFRNPAVTTWGW